MSVHRTRILPSRSWVLVMVVLASVATLAGPMPLRGQSQDQETTPRPIGLQDILSWKRITGPTLSDDGAWLAYGVTPTEGNSELVVRSTADTTEHRFPVGERGGSVAFR